MTYNLTNSAPERDRAESISPDAAYFDSVTISDVKPEKVDWVWQGRIPSGKVTIIEGHPGVGKSHLTLEIAARVTRGDALPDGETIRSGEVGLLSDEDGLADTIRPRLDAAGANLTRVHALRGIGYGDAEAAMPSLPADVQAIREYIVRMGLRLFIIDPLSAYLGSKTDSYKDHDMRRALTPLARVAEETGCAIIIVRHLTKASSGQAILAGAGSIGTIGQARCAMLVAADPENPLEIILAVVKNNLAVKPESLKFRLQQTEGGWARVEWIGTSHHSADALIAASRDNEEAGQLHEATQLLTEWLKAGAQPKADIVKLARDAGLVSRTLERAKQKMNVIHTRVGFGPGSRMMWQLPPYSPEVAYIRGDGAYVEETAPKPPSTNGLAYSPAIHANGTEPDYLSPAEERLYLAQQARIRGAA